VEKALGVCCRAGRTRSRLRRGPLTLNRLCVLAKAGRPESLVDATGAVAAKRRAAAVGRRSDPQSPAEARGAFMMLRILLLSSTLPPPFPSCENCALSVSWQRGVQAA
jgi:hypothetical protein